MPRKDRPFESQELVLGEGRNPLRTGRNARGGDSRCQTNSLLGEDDDAYLSSTPEPQETVTRAVCLTTWCSAASNRGSEASEVIVRLQHRVRPRPDGLRIMATTSN